MIATNSFQWSTRSNIDCFILKLTKMCETLSHFVCNFKNV